VLRVPTGGIDKIDLLFMIDNSASMADKQKLLRRAVPSLVSRFVTPLCVDSNDKPNGATYEAGHCTSGRPQFPAVNDIHIGVITSSVGAAGSAGQCSLNDASHNGNDNAWLLPKARPGSGLSSWSDSGFLNWDPKGKSQPNGARDSVALTTDFQNQVAAAGEVGCGFEASLESWYRFLVDPDPAAAIKVQGNVSVKEGLDENLLAQRRQFLRPDSLVAIVMLTDENDCSIQIGGSGLVIAGGSMWRPTAACAQNPDDPCCRSCGSTETKPPNGCTPIADDSECKKGSFKEGEDHVNLRCWDQKRRFGADFLEPTAKYVRALTQKTVLDRNGAEQPNPLFVGGRSKDLVYLAGIVGVPWQDIATADSLTGPGLKYLTAAELEKQNRWDMILGDPKTRKAPTDPHMVESPTPRTGTHPLLPQATLAPPDTSSPLTDVISGHEQGLATNGDLQYACIFELEAPTPCAPGSTCDCAGTAGTDGKRPLCQPPSGGAFGNTQYFAKAYPGLRQLEVLRGIGEQAIVASICPKVPRSANPETDANFGYNPAMDALVEHVGVRLADQCLARPPVVDDTGHTSCLVLEAQLSGVCDCNKSGRKLADADSMSSIRDDLRGKLCDAKNAPACSSVCACSLNETEGAALTACRSNTDPNVQAPGFCYVDPENGLGDPGLVRNCPSSKRRLLRFVGPETPAAGSIVYMACMGKTARQ
jgi:hypothetical protein